MPYSLKWESGGVVRRYFGSITILERRRSLEALCADERFSSLWYTITDFLDVKDYEVTARGSEEIAALHIGPLQTNPRIVIAAIATRPDVVVAIRAFIRQGFTDAPYRIFPTEAAARRWIASVHPHLSLDPQREEGQPTA